MNSEDVSTDSEIDDERDGRTYNAKDFTYSARLIRAWCISHQIEFHAHSAETPGLRFINKESGIRIVFANSAGEKDYKSIQTHPWWVDWAFAETAIQSDKLQSVVYPGVLGYGADVKRHSDPDSLFTDITFVQEKLRDPDVFQSVSNAKTTLL